ncbi:OLC1v1026125C1 [Oldenlandia corymbosa var. corymbosa]|uniref:OLC1v1026125C1 n=1 Tax=Oldenlandia corymbosa var. corymbosa TaxID=529605 RepID=A0AAV1C6N6_OLDCO|nr:OLC1v1026125C1 [Oldenlandia corymbosa var. corymbosa]
MYAQGTKSGMEEIGVGNENLKEGTSLKNGGFVSVTGESSECTKSGEQKLDNKNQVKEQDGEKKGEGSGLKTWASVVSSNVTKTWKDVQGITERPTNLEERAQRAGVVPNFCEGRGDWGDNDEEMEQNDTEDVMSDENEPFLDFNVQNERRVLGDVTNVEFHRRRDVEEMGGRKKGLWKKQARMGTKN